MPPQKTTDIAQKIRVLMISVRADYGGGPEHLYRLIDALPNTIALFVACPNEAPYWERYARIVPSDHLLQIPHRRFTLTDLFALVSFVRRHRIDIIHSHGKGAGVYGRIVAFITRKQSIHTFHGIHTGAYRPLGKWLYLCLERLFSAVTSRCIAVSQGEADLIRHLHLCDPNKLILIETGVVIPKQECRNRPDNDSIRMIISMTRFDYQKNSELILSILEALHRNGQLKRFRFVLMGSGEGQSALAAEIRERSFDHAVLFTGAIPHPEDYLKKAFCYLSTSRWEGMPLGVLEAMAAGLPVVATDVIGNRDAVDHGKTGFLYEQDSPQAAADHLVRLADDETLWRQFAEESMAKAEKNYSVNRMARRTADLYSALIFSKSALTILRTKS
jgi:glycosyltransferase involved in cell wall biosynthesis